MLRKELFVKKYEQSGCFVHNYAKRKNGSFGKIRFFNTALMNSCKILDAEYYGIGLDRIPKIVTKIYFISEQFNPCRILFVYQCK
jgi:hypothetical protein